MPYSANSDFRTSKGNVAPDFHWSGTDDAYQQRQALKNQVESQYSPARVVRDATRTYNCHAFAHANRHAWFNEITQFLRDDYYQFTPGTLRVGDVVVYVKNGELTHSGVITQLSNNRPTEIRSKWGAWPEVTHPPERVPDIYGPITYYLRRRETMLASDPEFASFNPSEKVDDLVYSLLSDERKTELLLASTVRVSELIISNFPEVAQLQFHSEVAGPVLEGRIADADLDSLAIIAVTLRKIGYSNALPKLAARVSTLGGDPTFEISELTVCGAFDALLRESVSDSAQFRLDCVSKAQALIANP